MKGSSGLIVAYLGVQVKIRARERKGGGMHIGTRNEFYLKRLQNETYLLR